MQHHNDLRAGCFDAHDLLHKTEPKLNETLNAAKQLARDKIFRHRSKLVHELATFPCLNSMLDLLIPAAHAKITQSSLHNVQHSLALDLLEKSPITAQDTLYTAYLKVLDFIGGMTDNYAAKTASELSGSNML